MKRKEMKMFDEMDALKAMLDESLIVKDNEGHIVLRPALFATVYMEDMYKRDVREAIVACCEDYFGRWGQHLRWALDPNTELMERFGEGKGSRPIEWLPARAEDESFALIYHDDEHERGAGAFSLHSFGPRHRPFVELGYFRITVPLLWFAEHPGSFPDIVLEIAHKLKPVSGYAGIGVVESPDNGIRHRDEPITYELAQRFPGFEADFPIDHGIWLSKGREGGKAGIKGVNWLTVLEDRWLAELGGAEAVIAHVTALDGRFVIHRFDGSLMIQAGKRPQLGDTERGVWPEFYVKLAKCLKPIRITQHPPFGYAGPGLRFGNRTGETEPWLRAAQKGARWLARRALPHPMSHPTGGLDSSASFRASYAPLA
jgi:hypothetical protein